MASRRLVPASVREAILGIPSDIASLERNYLLADDDLDLIGTRRRPENRLGLALHIALLRHPGQGWLDDTDPPTPLVAWLAEQIKVPFPALARSRGATRSNHRRLAIRHLGLRAFVPAHDMRTAMGAALLRRRPKGLLPAARQELLDPSKAWWGGRRGRLADRPRYSISVSLGVVPRWYSRVVEVPVRIEVAAGFVAPGASEPPRLQPSWPPGG